MPSYRSIPIKLALAAFSLLTIFSNSSLAARSTSELSDQPITSWPKQLRPSMTGKYIEVREDGPIEKRLCIASGNHRFIFEDKGRWVFTRSRTPRYSIMLTDRKIRELSFGVSRFSSVEFLATLQDESWLPYVASLKTDIPTKTVTYQHYTGEGRERPYILKNWTRKIEYEYPMGKGKIGKTREIFTFIDGDLFVFAFSGTREDIERLRDSHDMFLTRMNLYSDS